MPLNTRVPSACIFTSAKSRDAQRIRNEHPIRCRRRRRRARPVRDGLYPRRPDAPRNGRDLGGEAMGVDVKKLLVFAPFVLYVVTCGKQKNFIPFMTQWKFEAMAYRCKINKPASVFEYNGLKLRKVK